MAATMLIRVKIVAQINSMRDPRSQVSYLDRDFFGVLDAHREYYSKSWLRAALIFALGFSMIFGLCFTAVQGLSR
jgi:hypothetical protein